MEAFRCAPLLALCSSPMGVLSAWAAPLFHCFLKPVSFWVCGARQGQCDRAHPASLGVWNGCPLKHSEQFAFQTSDTIIWGDHGSKLWVIISGTGALNRSDNATKILQKWGKIILPKTLFLMLVRHYFILDQEVNGWQSPSSTPMLIQNFFCLFMHF